MGKNMMAVQPDRTPSKIDLSQNEISRIAKALKDDEFVKLLGDYAKEIHDPENKARYETEIAAMEAQRGCAVTFINPTPGYVIKTPILPAMARCLSTSAATLTLGIQR